MDEVQHNPGWRVREARDRATAGRDVDVPDVPLAEPAVDGAVAPRRRGWREPGFLLGVAAVIVLFVVVGVTVLVLPLGAR
jgi:hypothetical protein